MEAAVEFSIKDAQHGISSISDEIIQRDLINQELSNYISEAKHWQLNKFAQNTSTNNLMKR